MKDYKLKQRNLRASHSRLVLEPRPTWNWGLAFFFPFLCESLKSHEGSLMSRVVLGVLALVALQGADAFALVSPLALISPSTVRSTQTSTRTGGAMTPCASQLIPLRRHSQTVRMALSQSTIQSVDPEQRMRALNIKLPQPAAAAANYVPYVISENHVYIAGQMQYSVYLLYCYNSTNTDSLRLHRR